MYDAVIVGSGIVGLVNALLLAKNTSLHLAVVDANLPAGVWSETAYDSRVYAITPASQGILEAIDVWPFICAKRISPFSRMHVWDGSGRGELVFDHVPLNVPALGFIIEENLLRAALFEKLAEYTQIDLLSPMILSALQEQETYIELQQKNKGKNFDAPLPLRSQLLIGADGAQSWVRKQAKLSWRVQSYEQTSLIAQVQTEAPHEQTARQVFLSQATFPRGPLAFLPLQDAHQCSIVWSTTPAEADQLLGLDDQAFQEILGRAFDFRLGKILAVSKRQTFPLFEGHAENYVKNRLALIGDAAHTLHPLAGQGVNLGIADAASLAAVVTEAVKKGRDFASVGTLRRYERARKGNNVAMLTAVKFLKNVFTSENKSLALLRSQGLSRVNRFSGLKNVFARYAMGLSLSGKIL